jgi:hypothetical protein
MVKYNSNNDNNVITKEELCVTIYSVSLLTLLYVKLT